jgi:hypothetical protein
MVNCFIEIKKSTLKRRLKGLHIRDKYQNKICDGVKKRIEDSLENFIQDSIRQNVPGGDKIQGRLEVVDGS